MKILEKIFGTHSARELKKIEPIVDKIEAFRPAMQALTDEQLKEKTVEFKERLAQGESLDDILPEAYAVVREAAKRVLNMEHYRVQLIGGVILHQGRISEMRTGEGKTLVSTLPAYLNALTGKGVHVVTVNDYLAKRDAEWMGQVHVFLGLSVGVVLNSMPSEQRRAAYNCDITYVTNNELGFDYLRDNMVIYKEQLVLRGLNYCIIDEVDSVLIDEARTPLIISGQSGKSTALYEMCDLLARQMRRGDDMKELSKMDAIMGIVQEENGDFIVNEKDKVINLTAAGVQKVENFFHINNFADAENLEIQHTIILALRAHNLMFRDQDYVVKDNQVLIVDEFTGRIMPGRRYSDGLHQAIEAKEKVKVKRESKTLASVTFQNFFNLFAKKCGMTGTALTEENEFREIYGMDVVEVPTNKPVQRIDRQDAVYKTKAEKLTAIINEVEAAHKKGQPVLVGTINIDASEELSRLLTKRGIPHKVLNAKFHEMEAEIVADAGIHGAVTIATNMAGRGTDILLGGNPEYLAKQELRNEGVEPEKIELASSFIQDVDDEIKALRERYNEILKKHEAVTEKEKEEVIELGGLYILGTERHESRRIDNQLRGRAGRQGDPGKSLFFISLEDDLARRFGGERMKRLYTFFRVDEETPIQSKMLSRSIENAQRSIEGQNFGIRKNVIQYDDVMNTQRMVIYEERMRVIRGENVHEQILKLIPDYVLGILHSTVDASKTPDKWDIEKLNRVLQEKALAIGTEFLDEDKAQKWDNEYLEEKLLELVVQQYEAKIVRYREEEGFDYHALERDVLLTNVDRKWIDHIDNMDKLKRGISLRGFANEDPINAFKREGLEMFEEMIESIQNDTVFMLLKMELRKEPVKQVKSVDLHANINDKKTVTVKGEPGRNDLCPCGSGKKYKACCGRK